MGPTDNNDTCVSLRREVDALATALIVDEGTGCEDSVIRALIAIQDRAGACGLDEVETLAARYRSKMREGGSSEAGSLHALIIAMQEALEKPGASAGSVASKGGNAVPLPANFDLELFGDFLMESREHLTNIETQLLVLEQDPGNRDPIHTIFRGFHTIKGLAGFLEFASIQSVAHEVETALDYARNEELAITPEVIDVVLAATDHLKTELNESESAVRTGSPMRAADSTELLRRIQFLVTNRNARPEPVKIHDAAQCVPAMEATPVLAPEPARPVDAATVTAAPAIAPTASAPTQRGGSTGALASTEARAVKVDTSKLDFLVDMVGEMVIAQSLLRHDTAHMDPRVQRNLVQLTRITGEVQKTAMSMRMVPIGQLFGRMARLVRDLSRREGKQAELLVQGEDTELDRTIVEDLADPLMHMVRNSADHGIEPAAERVAAGKDPTGRIGLKAYHQAGYITIEVSDDGRGLDREKILTKARKNGLVKDGDELSDRDVQNLIFEPGFSTAEQVTDISGRGVGMDVVRKQVQKMRGRIDIQSQKGSGTTFFIRLPLTLAIIDGLVVGVGKERYVVPIFAIREMFRPDADSIKTVHGNSEMVLVRGSLMPVIRLHRKFNVQPSTRNISEGILIVAETNGKPFCLLVDEFIEKQEVVIKNLGERFRDIQGVSGGAILGDGRIGLILDMDALSGDAAHV